MEDTAKTPTNTHKEQFILLVIGKSGSGKDSLVRACCTREVPNQDITLTDHFYLDHEERLIKEFETNLKQVKSYTNRPKRYENEDTHIFTNESLKDKQNLVAWTKYNGYEYWATKDQIEESDFYIIDPKGISNFVKNYSGNKIPIVVYVGCKWWIRFKRIWKRENIFQAIKRTWYDRKTFKDIKEKSDVFFANNSSKDFTSAYSKLVLIFYPKAINI